MINYASLLKMSNVRRFAKDTLIIKERDMTEECMFVLLYGSAGVYKDYETPAEKHLATLGPGDVAGELVLFMRQPSKETVVALEDTLTIAINRQNASETFAVQPELPFDIIERICKKMYDLEQEYQGLITDVRAGVATKKLLESEKAASRSSVLFPKGHGSYLLPIDNSLDEYIYADTVTCPLCGHTFSSLAIITSRLRREPGSFDDMRVRYKDIEPMYYDIVSCPDCLFSMSVDMFAGTSRKFAAAVNDAVFNFKSDIVIKTGYERDTLTVFAGYYLALICSSICCDDHQKITASLWMKLSRIYSDLGDNPMYLHASEQCLKEYTYAYEHFSFSSAQMQQMCMIMGELYQRLGDLDQARTFYFYAKSNRGGRDVLKRQADMRLEEIREVIKKEKEAQLVEKR